MICRAWAQRAVDWTREQLGGEPENSGLTGICRDALGPHGLCHLLRPQGYRVNEVRDRTHEQLEQRGEDPATRSLQRVVVVAGNAIALRNGRCEEYASVALVYLRLHLMCPYPLDLAGYQHPGDHAFVIVGRRSDSDVSNPSTWGPHAVVCDAWANDVVNAGDYWFGMHAFPDRVYAPEVYLRLEGLGKRPTLPTTPPSPAPRVPEHPSAIPYARPGART